MSDRDGNSLGWFLAGLGLGAVVGILYAPRPGNETREAIRARAEEGRDYVKTRAREARQKDQFRAAYEAGRQAYHEATTETSTPKAL